MIPTKKIKIVIKHMVTKAQLISELKAKGVRGKLSKMTKPQLQKLHRDHSDISSSRGNLELEPLPGERTTVARKRSTYQEFVAQHLKENGGNMAAAASAYREQQGSGLAGDIGRKVGKAVTHGAVGVARGVRDAVKEELHHKKEDHKGGSMSDHAKHHSKEHMQAMEREMAKGASFDAAHDSAMETVGAGYDSDDTDQYMEGGAYWADKDFTMSMEPEMQGSRHWYNPFTWSSGTQQAVGTALQTAGMIGLGRPLPCLLGHRQRREIERSQVGRECINALAPSRKERVGSLRTKWRKRRRTSLDRGRNTRTVAKIVVTNTSIADTL
eukprot:COSAG05_NODE_322_length_11414_cov_47.115510_2_plen_326_part_00